MDATIMEGRRSILTPPYFDGTNYIKWRKHMKIFIESVDFKLWFVIKNGPNIPKKVVEGQEVEKSEDEFDDEDIKNAGRDSKAKNILYCAMNSEAFEKISNCQTAKEIWDELEREMTVANVNSISPQPSLTVVNSNLHNLPNLDFLSDTRESMDKFHARCVPLEKVALEGNWTAAKIILDTDDRLRHAAITRGFHTVLHVAAGASANSETHVQFVQELLALLDDVHITLQDTKGNTAFCFAVAAGNMPIVKLMLERDRFLPMIRGGGGVTPIQFAALQGRCEMAQHLYDMTKSVFDNGDWELLFFTCIKTGNYGLALQMAMERPKQLAFARDIEHDETALHLLAQKPMGSRNQSPEHHFPKINPVMKQQVDLQLVGFLWGTIIISALSRLEVMEFIRTPYELLFVAAEVGNVEFLSKLISAYPSLISEADNRNRSIIHIAVLHRHVNIYNLVHDIGVQKFIIVTYLDSIDYNTLLHLAAKLSPSSRHELVSGAAFQMYFELKWFEEVKKIVPPSFITMRNAAGLTASELFTKEHAALREKAESWMKGTAEQCMLISTVIASGVFSAAISLSGGFNNSTGNPNNLEKILFLVFGISDAVAFVLSAAAMLIFFSIIVSRYAEYDFYKSLPLKLMCGLVTLFFSITSMIIAFGSAFYISYYHYHGSKGIPCYLSVFACLPVFLLMFLQSSLWIEIIYSTYYCRNLLKPGKRMLHILDE